MCNCVVCKYLLRLTLHNYLFIIPILTWSKTISSYLLTRKWRLNNVFLGLGKLIIHMWVQFLSNTQHKYYMTFRTKKYFTYLSKNCCTLGILSALNEDKIKISIRSHACSVSGMIPRKSWFPQKQKKWSSRAAWELPDGTFTHLSLPPPLCYVDR